MKTLIITILLCASFLYAADNKRDNMKIQKYQDIKFATVHDKDLYMDIFVPEAKNLPTLIIWIHGGGWRNGSYKSLRLKWPLAEGYAIASIGYRLVNIDIFPAQIQDVKQAIRYLRANAEKYGYDPDNFIVAGSSAGGQLAMLAGVASDVKEFDNPEDPNLETSADVQGIINFFGPSDFIQRGVEQPNTLTSPAKGSFRLLGGKKGGTIDMDLAKQASPTTHVTKDSPRILSIQGLNDITVLPTQAERITEVYKEKGAQADLILVPDAGHGDKKCLENYKDEIRSFLEKDSETKTNSKAKTTISTNDYKALEDGSKLTLKTYYPAHYAPKDNVYPTIVFYFGGGWYGGDYDHFKPYAKYFVKKGFIIYTVEYRTKTSHGTSPRIALEDARSAMRWIKANAKEQGVDLKNLYAGGGSAGGCLAAAMAFESDINDKNDDLTISTMPTGLLLFNPVYDNGPGGYGYDRVEEYWEDFSPMNNLSSNTPPTLVLFGDMDPLVPVTTSKKYKAILDEYGVYNELHFYEGRGHGFFNAGKPDHKDTLIKADEFIKKTLK